MIDSRAFSEFCGVDSSNQIPDGDTIGRFRNKLVENGIQKKLFSQVVKLLSQKDMILKKGTIVDSTNYISSVIYQKQGEKARPTSAFCKERKQMALRL